MNYLSLNYLSTITSIAPVLDTLTTTVFPVACRLCQQVVPKWKQGVVCGECWAATAAWPATVGCQKCGYPLKKGLAVSAVCFRCRYWPVTAVRSCGPYQGVWQTMVHYLKSQPDICPQLQFYWQQCYQQHPILHHSDLIIPVPLHPQRQAERGFNQAELLAQALLPLAKLPVDSHSLIRQKATVKHRQGLSPQMRQQNVAQAFTVVRPRLVAQANILLIDDVFTTGNTVTACAKALLAAGARQVQVLTLARVI